MSLTFGSGHFYTPKKSNNSLMTILWFLLFLDLGGALGIKYIAIFAFGVIGLLSGFRIRQTAEFLCIAFLIVFWPVFCFFFGLVKGGDFNIALTQLTPFFCAAIILFTFLRYEQKDVLVGFYNAGLMLAILVHLIFILWIIIPEFWVSFFGEIGGNLHGNFGIRQVMGSEIPGIYFRSTLMLVPCCIYYFLNNSYIKGVIILSALLIAWSKAGALDVLLIVFISMFDLKSNNQFRIWSIVAFVALLFLLLVLNGAAVENFTTSTYQAVVGDNYTGMVRYEHFYSLLDLWWDEPSTFIFGQGFGISFYTTAYNKWVHNIELDHLNLIRKLGLIWMVLFSAIVLSCFLKLRNSNSPLSYSNSWALLGAFLAAGTNPLLASPIFLMYFMALINRSAYEKK